MTTTPRWTPQAVTETIARRRAFMASARRRQGPSSRGLKCFSWNPHSIWKGEQIAIDLVIYVLTVTNLIVRPQVPQFNRTRWTGGLVAFDRDAGEDLVPESSKQVEASTSGWTGSSQYGQYGTRSSTTGMWTGRTISHTYIHLKKGFLSVPGPSAGTVPRGCPQRQLCLAGPTASSSSSLLRTRLQSLGTSRVLVLVIGTSDPRSVPSGCQIMQLIAFFLLDNSLRGLPIYEYNCSLVAD